MSQTAVLSAYFKDADNKLHMMSAKIAIDPEGVTETDVNSVWHEAVKTLHTNQIEFKEPVLVSIQGGKA